MDLRSLLFFFLTFSNAINFPLKIALAASNQFGYFTFSFSIQNIFYCLLRLRCMCCPESLNLSSWLCHALPTLPASRTKWQEVRVREKLVGRGLGTSPVGSVVKNPPADGWGHRFDPWSGKIPHATGQLSPCATTTEPFATTTAAHGPL